MKTKDYSNEIDIRRFIREFKSHKWLLTSLFVVIFGLAIAYVARRESDYTAHSALLIEDNSDTQGARAGSMMQMMRIFSTGGFSSSSVDNEILLINTIDVAMRTVKELNLNINCIEKKGLVSRTLFEDAPISLTISDECADTLSKPFNVKVVIDNGKADIKVTTGRFFAHTLFETNNVTLPFHATETFADFTIAANTSHIPNGTYIFGVTGYSEAAWALYKDIDVKILDKLADGVEFTYTNKNRNKAMAVLNTMMNEYNRKRLERKRETSITELNFITDRINSLYTDLRESEEKVEKFKTESNFVDIEAEAPIILETTLNAHEELLKASAQILYYEQVLDILKNNSDGMLPAISTPGEEGSSSKSGLIGDYNEQMALLLELRRSAKAGNKALVAAETRVGEMRNTIVSSFTQLLKAAKTAVAQRSGIVGNMDSHLRQLPTLEKEYINLSRDQLLKNELYAFLVEKRENALMQLNSEDTLGFIIDKAYVEPKPSIKKAVVFLTLGFLFAVACPLLLTLILLKRNNLVKNNYDLTDINLETRTIEVSGLNAESIGKIRAAIMTELTKGRIYLAPVNKDNTFATRIIDAFSNAGISAVEKIPASTDLILSTSLQADILAELENVTYVFIPIHCTDYIKNLAPVINTPDTLCVIALNSSELTREAFSELVSGLSPENLLIVLIK